MVVQVVTLDCGFASKNSGWNHACRHDVHNAIRGHIENRLVVFSNPTLDSPDLGP